MKAEELTGRAGKKPMKESFTRSIHECRMNNEDGMAGDGTKEDDTGENTKISSPGLGWRFIHGMATAGKAAGRREVDIYL